MTDTPTDLPPFTDLGLHAAVLESLDAVGYESPTPIQARTIPSLLEGRDVLGQAQTGTGKTGAFALPILSRLDPDARGGPQALVLAPTRELAIQVAEAFHRYASKMPGFRVVPIYGGQGYQGQLRQLARGVHVVVGTPGRVMDHMRRGTLDLSNLKTLVLDEADEMLRMGFVDDVEWILERTPEARQIALFSATLAPEIRRIAKRHQNDPAVVTLEVKATTATTIRQRYWRVGGLHKLDALTRILEAEPFDAMIVFVRTKVATEQLAEKLGARGFDAAPINGDMAQPQRERTVEALRVGKLDILVATDVAARGLDVDRVSHVINFDIPYDTDSYVHRVGRTGRAGRQGEAILFVSPRERRMLQAIERATGQTLERMEMPSTEYVNDRRIERFTERITSTLAEDDYAPFHDILVRYQQEHDVAALDIAAALAKLLQGDEPLLLEPPRPDQRPARDRPSYGGRDDRRPPRPHRGRPDGSPDGPATEPGMERYRIEVGYAHGVQPGNIVGAIANEAGLEGRRIGRIDIHDDHSTVDLPEGMPTEIRRILKKVVVRGQALRITKVGGDDAPPSADDRPSQDRPSHDRSERRSPSDRSTHQGDRPRRDDRRPPRDKSDRHDSDRRQGDRPRGGRFKPDRQGRPGDRPHGGGGFAPRRRPRPDGPRDAAKPPRADQKADERPAEPKPPEKPASKKPAAKPAAADKPWWERAKNS